LGTNISKNQKKKKRRSEKKRGLTRKNHLGNKQATKVGKKG